MKKNSKRQRNKKKKKQKAYIYGNRNMTITASTMAPSTSIYIQTVPRIHEKWSLMR